MPRRKISTSKRRCVPDVKKQNIKRRDKNICLSCGSTERLTIDHIVPLARGGSNKQKNLQTLCHWCNALKGEKIISYNWRYGSRIYVKNMRKEIHSRL